MPVISFFLIHIFLIFCSDRVLHRTHVVFLNEIEQKLGKLSPILFLPYAAFFW